MVSGKGDFKSVQAELDGIISRATGISSLEPENDRFNSKMYMIYMQGSARFREPYLSVLWFSPAITNKQVVLPCNVAAEGQNTRLGPGSEPGMCLQSHPADKP